jgi:pSer/pThr/pTyr-binding forkhead associated (FHA) protein/Mg-chelatase subunit ChlD
MKSNKGTFLSGVCILSLIILSIALTEVTAKEKNERESNKKSEKIEKKKTPKAPKLDSSPRDIMIAIDNSLSMKTNDSTGLAREAVKSFTASLGPKTQVGIVIFDKNAVLVMPLTLVAASDFGSKLGEAIAKVDYSGKWTNIPAGIERALYELNTKGRKDTPKAVVFMTDGKTDLEDREQIAEKNRWLKQDIVAEAHGRGVRIFGISFTEVADFELIQTLAIGTDGGYYRVPRADELKKTFSEIQTTISASGVSFAALCKLKPTVIIIAAIAFTVLILIVIIVMVLFIFIRKKVRIPTAFIEDVDGQRGDPIKIAKAVFTIGRGTKNDLSIAKESVSVFHATIEYRQADDGFYLRDQRSSAKTFLNNREIREERLRSGDTIRLGTYNLRFKRPGESGLAGRPDGKAFERTIVPTDIRSLESGSTLPHDAMLVDVAGNAPQRSYKITKATIAIGRSQHENDIYLPDEMVSSFHAEIRFEDGNFLLMDKRSVNGTFLNNDEKRLPSGQKNFIKWGDEISIGGKYRFRLAPSELFKPKGTILGTPVKTDGSEGSPEQDKARYAAATVSPSCPNHPRHRPDRICSVCGKKFCAECVDDAEGGGYICHECKQVKKAVQPKPIPVDRPQGSPQNASTKSTVIDRMTVDGAGSDGKTIHKPPLCSRHPGKKPKYVCSKCRRPCCEDCVTVVDGKMVCGECLLPIESQSKEKLFRPADARTPEMMMHGQQGEAVESRRTHSDAKAQSEALNVNDYMQQKFMEIPESRSYTDSVFKRVLDPLNSNDNVTACREAESLIMQFGDFADLYVWWAEALLNLGQIDKAREVLQNGLEKANQKYSICNCMGKVEWKALDINKSIYWWIQGLHCQESLKSNNYGGETGAYLYLYYIAEGLGLSDCAKAFLMRSDRIRSGGIRLIDKAAEDLILLSKKAKSTMIEDVLRELYIKYYKPKSDLPKTYEVELLIGQLEKAYPAGNKHWGEMEHVDIIKKLGNLGNPQAIEILERVRSSVLLADVVFAAEEAIKNIEKEGK